MLCIPRFTCKHRKLRGQHKENFVNHEVKIFKIYLKKLVALLIMLHYAWIGMQTAFFYKIEI